MSERSVEAYDKLIQEERERLLRLQNDHLAMFRDRKLEFFIPQPAQMKFFENADKKRRFVSAGNRWGKSTVGTVELCSWLLGERIFFPKGHKLRRLGIPTNGVKILLIGADWDKLNEVFTSDELVGEEKGKIFEYLPYQNIVNIERNRSGFVAVITVENVIDGQRRRSSVYFDTVKSFIQDPASQESSDWDAIHVDEPIPEKMWKAVSRGLLDRFGSSWWLLTPLAYPWMSAKAKEESVKFPHLWFKCGGSMNDNLLISQEAKDLYLGSLKGDERMAREQGIPLSHGRLVYPHFNAEIHVAKEVPKGWKNYATPPADYLKCYSIDPHPQTPHAALFGAVSPFEKIHIYDESFLKTSIAELAALVNMRRQVAGHFTYELCDPIAWIENPDTGRRWVDTLFQEGLNLTKASKAKTFGIMQANGLFQPGSKRQIVVHPNCVNFISEIEGYYYNKENKPVDDDDHMMENFYRLNLHNDFKFIPQEFVTEAKNYKSEPDSLDPYDLPDMAI